MQRRQFQWLILLTTGLGVTGTGCGTYIAHRLVQAPNTFPQWVAPKAPVILDVGANFLTNFPTHFVDVGPPSARLAYRIVEPADYHVEATSTNWMEDGRTRFEFRFRAKVPPIPIIPAKLPRGTIVLLHGYGLSQFSMAPWALRLAEEGWRCVLLDLRGHGRSTGNRIFFGLRETYDLSQLLDALEHQGQLAGPVIAFGHSYGAALALQWTEVEPRVHAAVAIAPYANLDTAVLSIRHQYAAWIPKFLITAGLKKLPCLLNTQPANLNPTTWMERGPVLALFIAGEKDQIVPLDDVVELYSLSAPDSQMLVVPNATHEPLPFFFYDLVPPVVKWLAEQPKPLVPAG